MSKKPQPPAKVEPQPAPPVQEQAPPEETNVQTIQKEGVGRFEYQDGTVYQGQWKLVGNVKVKHGQGTVVIASTLTQGSGQKEEYSGCWVEDRMEGEGTYKYKSGAIYSGKFVNNKHHGLGQYQFPDGCTYEGEWCHHRMHGEGCFIDKEGNRWEGILFIVLEILNLGEFVEGIYQSKMQKQLKMEKMLNKKELEIKENCLTFFTKFYEAFAKSDKKTFKENMIPFFATQEEIKLYVKEPYPKFEDRAPDKWNDVLKLFAEFSTINVLRSNTQAKILDHQNLLATQFSGIGQVVEFTKAIEHRLIRLAICNAFESSWVLVFFHDSGEPEAPAKKK